MGGVNKFYITKLIFSKQSWKKNWKKLKKNASKASCWVPLTWLEHVQDMPRTWQDMPRTHEDSYGFLKTQNWTKTHQDTDIFVLQIAEQTFQICSDFPTKAASKIEPLCSQDMTGHMWSSRGFWKVRIRPEFDRNTGVFALKPVIPQPMNLRNCQCNGKPNTPYVEVVCSPLALVLLATWWNRYVSELPDKHTMNP